MLERGEPVEREVDVEDIKLRDMWPTIQWLRQMGLNAEAFNVAEIWSHAKAMHEQLLELSRQGV